MNNQQSQNAGLYIHVPFCKKKCHYCDFYSITKLSLIEQYMDCLIKEIDLLKEKPKIFDSIYIGGGTPSILDPNYLKILLKKIYNSFAMDKDTEITLEVNPESININKVRQYLDSGINRLNIGIQSFNDKNLKFLGRIHNGKDAIQSIKHAKKIGFSNIGIDLIFTLPEQSKSSWQDDIKLAIDEGVKHLSCYTLTYEKGTVLYKQLLNNEFIVPSDNLKAEMFLFTKQYLKDNGFEQYEISNYSKGEIYKSRHNQKYWIGAPYIGLGPSAHSYIHPKRYWNYSSIETYMIHIRKNSLPINDSEVLDHEQHMIEFIYLGLRCNKGIDLNKFEKTFNKKFQDYFPKSIQELLESNYIEIDDNFCNLTVKGLLLQDSIVKCLLYELSF